MIVCPLCEHAQAEGEVCDGCGKVLATRAPVAVPTQRIADLEQTTLPGTGNAVAVSPMPDMEVTRTAKVDVAVQAIPDVERTASEPVAEIPIARVPDIESGRAQDDGTRTVLAAGAITCRYCRNVQAQGSICDRCGMAFPKIAAAANATAAAAPPTGKKKWAATVWARCRKCGANAKGGERCGDCGQPVPMPDE